PTRTRVGNGIAKAFFIVAVGRAGTFIKASSEHRAVKTGPAMLLPKIDLQSGQIAKADERLQGQRWWKVMFAQINRAISAARGDKRVIGGIAQGVQKFAATFRSGA